MSDGVVSTKFVGSSNDMERTIASLEKKYQDLTNKIVEGTSKAKTAAQEARAALKQQEKDAADAARKKRDEERQLQAALRDEARKTAREKAQADRKSARDASDLTRQKQREESEARRAQAASDKEANRLRIAAEREVAREEKASARESARSAAATSREKLRLAKEESRERKRIKREEVREFQKMEREEKRHADSNAAWVQGIVGAATAYMGVSAILGTMIEQNKKLVELSDEQSQKQDKLMRQFRVQGELGKVKGEEASKRINKVALKNSMTSEQAFAGAEALAGHGFSAADASGPALDALLQGMVANNMGDQDPAELAGAMAMKLDVFGKKKNAANLKQSIVASQRLSKPTNTKVTDIAAYASKMSGIAEVVDEKTADSIMAVVHQTANTDVTGTAVKIMFNRMQSAHNKSSPLGKVMQSMTIKDKKTGKARPITPDDVDMNGESAIEAMQNIKEGIESLPEKLRPAARVKAFGSEAASSSKFLLDHLHQIKTFNALQDDEKGFDEDVAINTAGSAAGRRRMNLKRDLQMASKATSGTLVLDQLEMDMRDRGGSNAYVGFSRQNAELTRNLGANSDYVASRMTHYGPEGQKQYRKAIRGAIDVQGGEALTGLGPEGEKHQQEYLAELEAQKKKVPAVPIAKPIEFKPPKPAPIGEDKPLPKALQDQVNNWGDDEEKEDAGPFDVGQQPAGKGGGKQGGQPGANGPDKLEEQTAVLKENNELMKEQTAVLKELIPKQPQPIKRAKAASADEP
jgi:hypothetical protein